jgi:hypothetical protein
MATNDSNPTAAAALVTPWLDGGSRPVRAGVYARAAPAGPYACCATCRGHTVLDRGVDGETGADLIEECPEC